MTLGLNKSLSEISINNISGVKARPARKYDKLTGICEMIVQKNVESLTTHNPTGFLGLLQG
jgi:hypothetical protein